MKRGRSLNEEQQPDSPLSSLIAALKQARLPCVEASAANVLIGSYVRECLRYDDVKGTLRRLLSSFSWDAEEACFTARVDLFAVQTALQKHRYERLVELGSGSYAVVYKARNRETDEVGRAGERARKGRAPPTRQLAQRRLTAPATALGCQRPPPPAARVPAAPHGRQAAAHGRPGAGRRSSP